MKKLLFIASCLGFVSVLNSCGNNTREEATVEEYTCVETITVENRNTEWEDIGEVNALKFGRFDWLYCVGDVGKYEDGISDEFYELEDEGGHLLKPYNASYRVQYKYIDGEKCYRICDDHLGPNYKLNLSLNPHTTIDYIVDVNNRPRTRTKDVSSYTHFAEQDGDLYFFKF